jgi:hypothetical protein
VPLKILKGRKAKSPNLYIRGSYLGVAVDQSTKTDKPSVAKNILKRIEREIDAANTVRLNRRQRSSKRQSVICKPDAASGTSPN